MKALLLTTTLIEGITGLALFFVPSQIVALLLGTAMTDPASVSTGRLAGAGLITLATACWFSRNEVQPYPLVRALMVYNILADAILIYAVLGDGIAGPAMWPAIVFHIGILAWCVTILARHKKMIKEIL